jgi:hypothetical protein
MNEQRAKRFIIKMFWQDGNETSHTMSIAQAIAFSKLYQTSFIIAQFLEG